MASAQTTGAERVDEVRREASAHVGPLYLTPQVLLKELGVDSNVFNAAGEQESDFTFTVAPSADVWMPVARRALLQVRVPRTSSGTRSTTPSARSIRRCRPRRDLPPPDYAVRRNAYLNTRQRPNSRSTCGRGTSRTTLLPARQCASRRSSRVEVAGRGRDGFDADAEFDGISLQRTLNRKTTGFNVAPPSCSRR